MVQKRAKRRRKKGEGELMEKRRGLTRRQLAYRRKGGASCRSKKSKQLKPVVNVVNGVKAVKVVNEVKLKTKLKGNGIKRSQRSAPQRKVLYKRRSDRKYRCEYNQSKELMVLDTPQHRLFYLLECMLMENSPENTLLEKGKVRLNNRKAKEVMETREQKKKAKLIYRLSRDLWCNKKQGMGRVSYSGYGFVEGHRSARPPRRETKSRKKGGTVRQRPKGVSTKRSLYRGAKWVRDGVLKAKKNTGQGIVKALMVDRGGRK